jgi:hypothetical protein
MIPARAAKGNILNLDMIKNLNVKEIMGEKEAEKVLKRKLFSCCKS